MSSLPSQKSEGDKKTRDFFDKYFVKPISYSSNEVDAVIAFFEKRGFDNSAAISVGTVLLQQAKLDKVNVFTLLDTLRGLKDAQISAVVAEVLNYNRSKVSTLGFNRSEFIENLENRNIAV